MTPLQDRIIDFLYQNGQGTIAEFILYAGIPYISALNHFKGLWRAGEIERVGKVDRRHIYALPRSVDIEFPRLDASKYRGWRPTGTPANQCRMQMFRWWGR